MHCYGVLSYFRLLNNISFLLGFIAQHNEFHSTLFSTLIITSSLLDILHLVHVVTF